MAVYSNAGDNSSHIMRKMTFRNHKKFLMPLKLHLSSKSVSILYFSYNYESGFMSISAFLKEKTT